MTSAFGESPEDLSATLLLRLRGGDRSAGEALEHLHRPALVRFARRYLRNEHDAEDAVQETFARILQAENMPLDFRVWSYRIARNVCLNHLRTGQIRGQEKRLATGIDIAADQTGQFTRLVQAEDDAALGVALGKLSDAQREVLILRYLEGLGREEIAAVLEVTVAVVKSRLFEGVTRLRQLAGE